MGQSCKLRSRADHRSGKVECTNDDPVTMVADPVSLSKNDLQVPPKTHQRAAGRKGEMTTRDTHRASVAKLSVQPQAALSGSSTYSGASRMGMAGTGAGTRTGTGTGTGTVGMGAKKPVPLLATLLRGGEGGAGSDNSCSHRTRREGWVILAARSPIPHGW